MKIDTLNNNGVINDFSLHQEVSMPVRMPYPESWQKGKHPNKYDCQFA